MSNNPAIIEVAEERAKQILKWGCEHDAGHSDGELLFAALELIEAVTTPLRSSLPDMWGLVSKHQTPRARLRIAAALIVAEMDRRDLLENREPRT